MEMNSVMHNDLKEVLLTEEDIQNICKELETINKGLSR